MKHLEDAAVAAGVLAWCFAGPVTWMLLYVLLPGMAADRARARRRAVTGEDHHDT